MGVLAGTKVSDYDFQCELFVGFIRLQYPDLGTREGDEECNLLDMSLGSFKQESTYLSHCCLVGMYNAHD